jgi:uncharacterized membrane protein
MSGMKRKTPFTIRVLLVLFLSSMVSIGLLLIRMITVGNTRFSFLSWNLFLAWLPLLFALGLRLNLEKRSWLSWQNIGLSILWLGFLPNSFYLMSDMIHIQSSGETSVLYDSAMILSFVLNGMMLGYISTYIVHLQLRKRLQAWQANAAIVAVFFSCGFAIYLGRYLRWNTWDILLNPGGLLFDLSERLINPLLHTQTFSVTLVFGFIIAATYAVLYELVDTLRAAQKS